jgi:hypothetical protein
MSLVLDGTNGLSDIDGSAATPAIRGTDANTGIFFPAADTIAFAEGGAEVARFDSSGNVGIGTSSPAGKLHTVGSSGVYSLITQAPSTAGTYYHQLFKNDSTDIAYASSGGSVFAINTVGATPLVFGVNAIESARIDSSGNLLVGTTSQFNGARLSVVGSSGVTNPAAAFVLNGSPGASSYNVVWFSSTGQGSAGAVIMNQNSVSLASVSDYRQKTDIEPLTGAVSRVMRLAPKRFHWTNIPEEHDKIDGFIAHEVYEVVPEAVFGGKDAVKEDGTPNYQMMDASKIVPLLTAAIQEQQALIASQSAIILAQQTALTALTARVEALDARLISLEGTQP